MSKQSNIVPTHMKGGMAITDRQKTTFLEALRDVPNVSRAAAAAGMSRQSAYNIKHKDEEFRTAWQAALDEALDKCEEKLFERSHTGKSDVASIFLLKHHRPWIYSDSIRVEQDDIKHEVIVQFFRSPSSKLGPEYDNFAPVRTEEVVDAEVVGEK